MEVAIPMVKNSWLHTSTMKQWHDIYDKEIKFIFVILHFYWYAVDHSYTMLYVCVSHFCYLYFAILFGKAIVKTQRTSKPWLKDHSELAAVSWSDVYLFLTSHLRRKVLSTARQSNLICFLWTLEDKSIWQCQNTESIMWRNRKIIFNVLFLVRQA